MTIAYFVSDVHFRDAQRRPEQTFLRFLEAIKVDAEALYLVGDVFDFWVGHRELPAPLVPLVRSIGSLTAQGVEVHHFTGNHDPAPIKALENLGVKTHPEGISVQLGDFRYWVEHGDLLDPSSHLRRHVCRLARNEFVHTMARLVPMKLAWQLSGMYTQHAESYDRPLHQSLLNQWLVTKSVADFDGAVLGHYHRAAIHRTHLHGRPRTLIGLGDWIEQMTYARFETTLQLYRFSDGELCSTPLPLGDHCPPTCT